MVNVREDMTGWKMSEHGVIDSKLTVIEQTEDYVSPAGEHYAQWLCECNCMNKTRMVCLGNDIKRGKVKSCGCSRLLFVKKRNDYDLSGEYGIGYCSNTGTEFYFDIEDFDKIKDYCWYEAFARGYSYVNTNISRGKSIRMHQLLGYTGYDHIDRNALNNRKCNFRQASNSENARNHTKANNNTSGFIGVSWNKQRQKWVSYIIINNANKYLGIFKNKEDAIKMRLQAEAKYFGEFAPQKHLFEEYGIEVNNIVDNL